MYVWKEIYCYFYIEKHKFQHIFDNIFTLEQFLAILSKTIIWKLFYNNFSKLFYITTDEFFFISQHCPFSETHGNCLPMYLFLIAVKLEVPVLKRLNKLVHNKCIHNAKSVNNMCTRNSCNIIALAMGQVIWICLMSQTSVMKLS